LIERAINKMNPDCIFCRIVAGEIPCHRLYEDEYVLAFLDIGPVSTGHCLIVPKVHYDTLDAVPDECSAMLAAVLQLVPRLARAVTTATGTTAWNLLQNNGTAAGQAVAHVHFHIIPRNADDGLGYRWPAGKLEPAEAERLLARIESELSK
jgi:histidine triad (HIT) family protein